jgi:hypothetical protein
MNLGFRGYTVGNSSTPPNINRVNTLPWTIQWHYVAGILCSGAREYNFLELGSQRSYVLSWQGEIVSGTFRQEVSAGQPSSRGNYAIIIFVVNSSKSSYIIYRYTI